VKGTVAVPEGVGHQLGGTRLHGIDIEVEPPSRERLGDQAPTRPGRRMRELQ